MSDTTMVRNGGEAPAAAKGGAGAEIPVATADAMMNQDGGHAPDQAGTSPQPTGAIAAVDDAHVGGAVHAK